MNVISKKFGGRIRLRVCALIYDDERLLLIRHKYLGEENEFWAPPGGGVDFGEPLLDALRREVREETGLNLINAEFRFINEFIAPPLHAVEFFFHVSETDGAVKTGTDPEMGSDQIIEDVQYLPFHTIRMMKDKKKHNILQGNTNINNLQSMRGHYKFTPSD